jgi:hypothetical protein
LATSEWAALIELGPSEDRRLLLGIAPASGREFLKTRADDVDLLERVHGGAAGAADLEAIAIGTDWLQRRVVEQVRSPRVLQRLASDGRTRRVRNAAAAGLQTGRKDQR